MNKITEVTFTERVNSKQPYRWATATVRDGKPGKVVLLSGSISDGSGQYFSVELAELPSLIAILSQINKEILENVKEYHE